MGETFDDTHRCRHFTGVMDTECKAGVNYHELVGDGVGCWNRLPCIRPVDGDVVLCPLKATYTPDELVALQQETDAAIAQMLTRLATGLCVECGEQPDHMVQVGRSYYAEPCRHRQGQGSAKAWNTKHGPVTTDRPPWVQDNLLDEVGE